MMAIHNMLDNGEPKTCTSLFTTATFIYAVKSFENTRQVFRWDPFTKIPYVGDHILLGDLKTHHHFTLIKGVLDSVGNQVGHHLTDPLPISVYQCLMLVVIVYSKLHIPFVCFVFKLFKHLLGEFDHINALKVHFDLAGFDV